MNRHTVLVILAVALIGAAVWAALITAALLAAHLGGTTGSEVTP